MQNEQALAAAQMKQMPRYIAILFALPLFFVSCERYDKNKPTEFFKIKEKVSKYESKSKFD